MNNLVTPSPTKMNPHKAMLDYIQIRDARAELAKKDKAMKAVQDKIAAALLLMSKEQDVEGFRAEDCLCYQAEKSYYTVKDAEAFFNWVVENGEIDALHKRVNATYAADYIKQTNGELPPGISVERELAMHVRRVNEPE